MLGFLKKLFGKPQRRWNASVWLTHDEHQVGLLKMIRSLLETPVAVVLVVHFESTMEEITAAFDEEGIRWHALTQHPLTDGVVVGDGGEGSVGVVYADMLLAETYPVREAQLESYDRVAVVLVAEMYPIPVRNAGIDAFADALPFDTEVVVTTHLQDPSMAMFAGPTVLKTLQRLGLKEGEAVEHQWIANSIARAQRSMEKQGVKDVPAKSAEEWFKLNATRASGNE